MVVAVLSSDDCHPVEVMVAVKSVSARLDPFRGGWGSQVPKHTQSGSGGNALYLPHSRQFHSGKMQYFESLQLPVMVVPLSPLWPIVRDDPIRIGGTVLVLPHKELELQSEEKETLPYSQGLALLPYLI